ncbi:MAG: hypothetical protein WD278_11405, partial [Pirellulales bacterium]
SAAFRSRPFECSRHVRGAVLAIALLGCWGVAPVAAQEAAERVRIASLISKLASDSYAERDSAHAELSKLGMATREQLQQAALSDDAEVRLRAKDLLRGLAVEELWSAGQVTIHASGTPASAALETIAGQTGNRLLVGDQYGSFRDQPVELDYSNAPFWKVVDDLCRQTGNRVRPHYDTRQPGLVLVSGQPGKNPAAYSGPLRVQVTSARRVFTEELDYEKLESQQTHTFQLDLQALWEDRFKLVAYRSQAELIEAITDTGARLTAAQPASGGWNVAGAGTRQLALSMRLHPPSTAAARLDTLKLRWDLIAVGDMAHIDVEDLESQQPHFQDNVELVVESFKNGPSQRCEIVLLVVRDLVVPEPQELVFQENEVHLFDAEGRAFRRQGQTNSLTPQGARMKITFTGESANSTPKRLRFVYPRIRAQKQMEIDLRNVPLPRARPE